MHRILRCSCSKKETKSNVNKNNCWVKRCYVVRFSTQISVQKNFDSEKLWGWGGENQETPWSSRIWFNCKWSPRFCQVRSLTPDFSCCQQHDLVLFIAETCYSTISLITLSLNRALLGRLNIFPARVYPFVCLVSVIKGNICFEVSWAQKISVCIYAQTDAK